MSVELLKNAIVGLNKTFRKSFLDYTSLSLTELQTIMLIYNNQRMLPSELATKTKITSPSMSQILKKMERLEVIVRSPTKEDGRKVFISLTKKGIQLVEEAKSYTSEILGRLIETHLTKEEIEILERAIPVLEKLNHTS